MKLARAGTCLRVLLALSYLPGQRDAGARSLCFGSDYCFHRRWPGGSHLPEPWPGGNAWRKSTIFRAPCASSAWLQPMLIRAQYRRYPDAAVTETSPQSFRA